MQTMKFSDGPQMNSARASHGCTTIPPNNDTKGRIYVVGGIPSGNITVEYLEFGSDQWIPVKGAAFPLLDGPNFFVKGQAVTPSNSPKYILYSIGGQYTKEIFGLTPSFNFEHVASLTELLNYHSSLNLARKEIPGCI